MAKKLSEKQIKRMLKIKEWSELPKDKEDDLARLLTQSKRDVAIGIVNQLPDYVSCAKEMITHLTSVCEKSLTSGDKAHQNAIDGYMRVLSSLEDELNNKRLTWRRRKHITNKMFEISEKMSKESEDHRKFVLDFTKTVGTFGVILTSVIALPLIIAKTVIKK